MIGRNCHVRERQHHSGEPPLGAHLVTSRAFYTHHGLYVGGGCVIHYSRGRVEEISVAGFADGRGVRIRRELPRFDRREVVERARSRLGEHDYRLLTNNCEHFCAWALQGESRSRQVDRFRDAWQGLWRRLRLACFLLRHPHYRRSRLA